MAAKLSETLLSAINDGSDTIQYDDTGDNADELIIEIDVKYEFISGFREGSEIVCQKICPRN